MKKTKENINSIITAIFIIIIVNIIFTPFFSEEKKFMKEFINLSQINDKKLFTMIENELISNMKEDDYKTIKSIKNIGTVRYVSIIGGKNKYEQDLVNGTWNFMVVGSKKKISIIRISFVKDDKGNYKVYKLFAI